MLKISVSAYLHYQDFEYACHIAYKLVKSKPDNEEYFSLMGHCMEMYRIDEGRKWEPGRLRQELEELYSDPDSPFHLLQA